MTMRQKGWKFACWDCYEKHNIKPKEDKVWMEDKFTKYYEK